MSEVGIYIKIKLRSLKLYFFLVEIVFSWSRSCFLSFFLGLGLVFFLFTWLFLFSWSKACFLSFSLKSFFYKFPSQLSKKVKTIFVAYREVLKIHGNAEKGIFSYWPLKIVLKITKFFALKFKPLVWFSINASDCVWTLHT